VNESETIWGINLAGEGCGSPRIKLLNLGGAEPVRAAQAALAGRAGKLERACGS